MHAHVLAWKEEHMHAVDDWWGLVVCTLVTSVAA